MEAGPSPEHLCPLSSLPSLIPEPGAPLLNAPVTREALGTSARKTP